MFDLHYWPTPNGKKVTILLEELGAEYRIIPCNIGRGDQFSPDFLRLNPNHRMPVLVDNAPGDGGGAAQRVRVGRDHALCRGEGGGLPSAATCAARPR